MSSALKTGSRATSVPVGLAFGAAVSFVITLLISAIGAHLISSEILPHEQIGYCSIAALLAGTILGAITASGKIQRRKPMICFLSGGIYYCTLLAVTALFFGGQYSAMGVTLIVVLLGSAAAALISGREKKNKRVYKRKKSRR